MECAILYEAHLQDYVDGVVAVVAPEEVRVRRIMQRDGITEQRAREWLAAQMPQEEVQRRADYSICNDGIQPLAPQIENILQSIERQN
jgi:dephospho-CoA kinase